MKYEQTGDELTPHKITFKGEEVPLVRAVFREAIYNLARKGNPGSISGYEATVAGWKDGQRKGSVSVISYVSVTDRLEEFHTNTGDAITDIVDVSGIPAFENDAIHRRYMLGQRALLLAGEIEAAALQRVSAQAIEEAADFLRARDEPQ
jgi:hypothetical protein